MLLLLTNDVLSSSPPACKHFLTIMIKQTRLHTTHHDQHNKFNARNRRSRLIDSFVMLGIKAEPHPC